MHKSGGEMGNTTGNTLNLKLPKHGRWNGHGISAIVPTSYPLQAASFQSFQPGGCVKWVCWCGSGFFVMKPVLVLVRFALFIGTPAAMESPPQNGLFWT